MAPVSESPPPPWVPSSDPQERLERLIFPRSQEDWEAAQAENEAEPREPGKWKVGFGGPPQQIEPYELTCEDCGEIVQGGGGIRFGDPIRCKIPAHWEVEDCFGVHIHWMYKCPAWKHKRYRFKERTYGRHVRNRWMSWKWRRRARKEKREAQACNG